MRTIAILMLTASAVAAAQNPPPPPPMGRGAPGGAGGDRSAQMLLARSAELDLTDAQVVKLAAITRRSEARRRTLRAAMDSGRGRFAQPGDSLARRQFGERMEANMTRERDQARVDLRDAIAVLTTDQQARAWEMVGSAGRGRPGRGMGPDGRAGRRGPRAGPDEFGPGRMGARMNRGRMAPDEMPRRPNAMRPRRGPIDELPLGSAP